MSSFKILKGISHLTSGFQCALLVSPRAPREIHCWGVNDQGWAIAAMILWKNMGYQQKRRSSSKDVVGDRSDPMAKWILFRNDLGFLIVASCSHLFLR